MTRMTRRRRRRRRAQCGRSPSKRRKGERRLGGRENKSQNRNSRLLRQHQAQLLDQKQKSRKVAVKVKLRTAARKKVVARRESSQSEGLQAPPVKVMRNRRTRSGQGSNGELTRERKHSQANPGSPTPCTVPTTQMTSKSTGGCTSATGRRTA